MTPEHAPADESHLSRRLRLASEGLVAGFREAAALRNSSARGSERESLLLTFLREHLPHRFEVGSGCIASAHATPAHQHDVVIADAATCVLLFSGAGQSLYPIEAVEAVVSVKSGPDVELAATTGSFATVRELIPSHGRGMSLFFGEPGDALHSVFAFRAPKDPVDLCRQLDAENYSRAHQYRRLPIDMLVALTSGDSHELASGYVIGYAYTDIALGVRRDLRPVRGMTSPPQAGILARGASAFADWYVHLVQYLYRWTMPAHPDLSAYLRAGPPVTPSA